jgi:hypothetical protein
MPRNPAPAAPLHPWDIRDDETARAYAAFAVYRDMGPDRSLERLGRDLGKTKAAMEQWSVKHGWQDRVRSFDAEAARRAAVKSLNDHTEVRTRQAQLGRMMQARGAQRIGQLDPSTLEAKEARALAVEGAKMEREALGMAAKHEVSGPGGGPIETRDVTEIDRRAARILATLMAAGEAEPDDADD